VLWKSELRAHLRECLIQRLSFAGFHLGQALGDCLTRLSPMERFDRLPVGLAIDENVSALSFRIENLEFIITGLSKRSRKFLG
jgi:hypothetical protein